MERTVRTNGHGNSRSLIRTTRPLKYNRSQLLHLIFQMALLGARNEDIANTFQVSLKTVEYWLRYDDGIREAFRKGKTDFDAQVAESLGKRAMGYDVQEWSETIRPNYRTGEKEVIRTTSIKHIPGDPSCMIFWLKNRQRETWQDANRIDSYHTINVNINHRLNVQMLNESEKEVLKGIIVKQLSSGNAIPRGNNN